MASASRQLVAPGGERLTRARIDQVERSALERRAGDVHGGAGFGHGMQAAERAQIGIIERLHAERDAVDAGAAVAAEAIRLHARGIGLQRDLGAGLHRLQCEAMASRMAPTVAGCISDGVPPPKKTLDTARPGASEAMCASSRRKAAQKARLVDAAGAHVAVEVAVGALGGAERPVHVDAEARAVRQPHRGRLRRRA